MADFKPKQYKINMCEGPLLKQIIVFTIPLSLSALLQFLFNAADLIVVGQFASHQALAAVGATASLTSLIINIFLGVSIGTNVVVARYIGENNNKKISRATHTAIYVSLLGGVILSIIGLSFSKTFLQWMSTPEDVLDMATLYMRIYFAGMPIIMLFNFGSAILRAIGDTKRPFYFLIIAGIINVLLNMFFVIVCHWDAGGVATATVISQGISAFMILQVLRKSRESYRVNLKKLHINWSCLKEMMRIGIPAGFQSSCFSLANIMIQSGINSFGAEAVAGNTAAMYYETIGYIVAASIGQATISFVSQNYGGKQYNRIRQAIRYCTMISIASCLILETLLFIFRYQGIGLFNDNPTVIQWGVRRLVIILPFYFVCATMEITVGSLRGLGHSILPTIIMIFGVCIFRIFWMQTIFKHFASLESICWSFPVSWIIVVIFNGVLLLNILKKFPHDAVSSKKTINA
ncbi:MAG: MATE family efflux transporter [Lentisphaeria bacterium]|nr:MATE family efflux transporter [Lentisphaeria bacterium]